MFKLISFSAFKWKSTGQCEMQRSVASDQGNSSSYRTPYINGFVCVCKLCSVQLNKNQNKTHKKKKQEKRKKKNADICGSSSCASIFVSAVIQLSINTLWQSQLSTAFYPTDEWIHVGTVLVKPVIPK